MSQEAIDRLSPLAADVRAHSPDRYLATLFAPPAKRESLFALYAFDHEMARVQTIVREPMAGLVRLQWWQDVIDDFEGGDRVAHPVVQALRRAVIEGGLDRAHLAHAIDARRQPFEEELPSTADAFKTYLHGIGGSITCAAATLLGADDREVLMVARRIGMVVAAWEQCRLIERPGRDRTPWLPLAWLDERDDRADGRPEPDVVRRLAAWASAELASARRQQPTVARSVLAAFFPGTLSGLRLGDPSGAMQKTTLPMAVPRLFWHWLRGAY